MPGIALSGHTDVVPVDGQPWDTDPFSLVEKDGRLYGRGTSDMKSFSAIALALVPEFTARPLKTPIHFALSFDEEVGCLGAPLMINPAWHHAGCQAAHRDRGRAHEYGGRERPQGCLQASRPACAAGKSIPAPPILG